MAEIQLPEYQLKSIPSGGVAYPANWEISIEPYRFGAASTVGYNSIASKRFYTQITEGVHCNFPKKLLTVADVLFLGIARKLVSIESDKVTLKATCPACLENVDPTMSLKDLVKFKVGPIKNRDKYPVKATFTRYIGWYRMLTVDDYVDLLSREEVTPAQRLAKATYKLVEINPDDDTEVVRHCPAEDASIMKMEDIAKIYDKFVGRDAEILDRLLEIFEPVELEPIEIECTNPDCRHVFKRTIAQEELTRVLQPFRPESAGVPEDFIDL